MKAFKFGKPGKSTSGIVTVSGWIRMPDGEQYQAIWAERWEIVTDKAVPIEGFRSQEHWQLAAVGGGDVLLLIPGCKVSSWAYCAKPPKCQGLYVIK